METLHLIAHRAHPPVRACAVAARVLSIDAHWLVLRWSVERAREVIVPPFAGNARADGLWQTTCFELFVTEAFPQSRGAYSEFNFAPSERWAAYDFTGYRTGMAGRAMPRAPVITPRRGGDVLICDVALPIGALPPLPLRYGLTAVIEEAGGVKSYWAAVHGERPDFHDPACLAGVLAAPVGT